MRWNYEVRLNGSVLVEGFTRSELEARKIAQAWVIETVLTHWPDTAPTSRVWQ